VYKRKAIQGTPRIIPTPVWSLHTHDTGGYQEAALHPRSHAEHGNEKNPISIAYGASGTDYGLPKKGKFIFFLTKSRFIMFMVVL
jgi:hypothetical protein